MLFWLLDLLRDWSAGTDLDGWFDGFPFSLLDQVVFRSLASAMGAFALVVLLGHPVIGLLRRAKIGDAGQTDAGGLRAHAASKRDTPTMGGVLICGSILACTALLADVREQIVVLGLVVLVWLSVLGGFDDWLKLTAARREGGRQGLRAWEKLIFQLGLGLLVGVFAFRVGVPAAAEGVEPGPTMWHVVNIPFQRTYEPGTWFVEDHLLYLPAAAYVLVSVLLLPGMSNAVNLTDGMDGLASGIAAAVSFGLMLLALVAGDEGLARQYFLVPYIPPGNELGVLAGAMAGACLGFLWWNGNPAQVFMGDTGSLALGGLIAYISIVIRQEALMLLMCGVFLVEMFSVIAQVGYFRLTGGRRIFRCAPYHHHLQMGGWPESRVVARLWIVTILLTVAAFVTLKVR